MSPETPAAEEDENRFDLELFVIHPTLHPDDISRALDLDAHFTKTVGAPRTTPKGTPLSGTYADTRWRHRVRHAVPDQYFAEQLADFVERLKSRSEALAMLRETGGQTTLVVQFLGDGFLGDDISHKTLTVIVELGLSLGIECFTTPQG
jgi:hypothetical protein